ncbi:sirohydrochlorin cobaltochelatase [Fundidesulfovibrio soli]|uniref:sirohydrochlorin cobaltochelatase n=1 Tax=Fundidesulfovibrio soli TaxID=2922716 RepID=UPI001FAF2EE7|nr:sirohydrochlorin cobaltochelatase [Fundidesulfovibrio soli]
MTSAFPPALRGILVPLLVLACLVSAASGALAHGEAKNEGKTGLLLVAFGTSAQGADAAYANIEAKVRERFPGMEVRWAYTSVTIRNKLAKEKGVRLDSPALALARMADEGFGRVAVQSLQTIPGEEFEALRRTALAFSGMPKGIARVEVGEPLLASPRDMERAAAALLASVSAERKPGEAVVLVGHGSRHNANASYPALQYYLWRKDRNAFVGTVDASPSREDVLAELARAGLKKAWLVPLLAVAGEHARNDMAGDGPDSWKTALEAHGVACAPVLKGTGEMGPVADIWIDHLAQALERLR